MFNNFQLTEKEDQFQQKYYLVFQNLVNKKTNRLKIVPILNYRNRPKHRLSIIKMQNVSIKIIFPYKNRISLLTNIYLHVS